jgi:hypothetical protein
MRPNPSWETNSCSTGQYKFHHHVHKNRTRSRHWTTYHNVVESDGIELSAHFPAIDCRTVRKWLSTTVYSRNTVNVEGEESLIPPAQRPSWMTTLNNLLAIALAVYCVRGYPQHLHSASSTHVLGTTTPLNKDIGKHSAKSGHISGSQKGLLEFANPVSEWTKTLRLRISEGH